MLLLVVITGFVIFLIAEERKGRRENEAIRLDCDMSSMFLEMLDDPFMDDKKWMEWLPIFEYADSEVKRLAPRLSLGNRAKLVRTRIFKEDITGTND